MTTSSLYAVVLLSVSSLACSGGDFMVGDPDPSDGDLADGGSETDGLAIVRDTGDSGISVDAGDSGPPDGDVAPEGDAAPDSTLLPDAAPEVDAAPDVVMPTQKRVFVTSESYTADLGGLAGADAKCQTLADAAKLGGTYRAWLSDSVTSAKTRLTHSTVPYRLVDGTKVVADWADLATAPLLHAIDVTEKGTKPTYVTDCGGVASVWSNSTRDGTRTSSFSCENWTSKTASDTTGAGFDNGRSDSTITWTIACGSNYCFYGDGKRYAFGLYCFEQ